jgi:hypothetical protein
VEGILIGFSRVTEYGIAADPQLHAARIARRLVRGKDGDDGD